MQAVFQFQSHNEWLSGKSLDHEMLLNPVTIHSLLAELSAVPQYWQLMSSVSPTAPPQLGHWC